MLAVRHANPFIIRQCLRAYRSRVAQPPAARLDGECAQVNAAFDLRKPRKMRAALRRDVCSRDLFDLEPIHAPTGIARPPAVPSFVITVIAAETG